MFYSLLKTFLFCLAKIFFRLKIIGKENIPLTGPVVIASNHISLLDPPIIGVASPRKVHFMAKQELFVPIIGPIFKILGAFPVRRGSADRNAIKHGIDLLNAAETLVVFPEGTRSKTGRLGQAQPGALMMAGKAHATIVPTIVSGTNIRASGKFWPQITVTFGKPLNFPADISLNKDALNEMTYILMQKMHEISTKGEEK